MPVAVELEAVVEAVAEDPPATEGLVATSDGLVATSEELTPAAVPASEWLVATRALEEDAAAEELMTAGSAAAEGPRSRDASCSWRCPEQSKRKILHDC